jgi:hypothetical protein
LASRPWRPVQHEPLTVSGVLRDLSDWTAALAAAWGELCRSRRFFLLLVLLLPVSGAFIGLDISRRILELSGSGTLPAILSLETEFGLGESFEYLTSAAAAGALFQLYRRTALRVYGVTAALFMLYTIDNALRLHESAGSLTATLLASPTGLAQQAGELLAFAAAGSLILRAAFRSLANGGPARNGRGLLVLLLALAAASFGIGFDVLHMAAGSRIAGVLLGTSQQVVGQALAVLEDGGELLILTLACAASIALGSLPGGSVPPRSWGGPA